MIIDTDKLREQASAILATFVEKNPSYKWNDEYHNSIHAINKIEQIQRNLNEKTS